MQTDRTRYVPRRVRQAADVLRDVTGDDPEIDQPGSRRWRITMRNPRVLMTLDFVRTVTDKIKQDSTELRVDGEPREPAEDEFEFARIFADPDSADRKKIWTPAPTPPERPIEDAPGVVQGFARPLRARFTEAETKVGFDGTHWIVFLLNDEIDLRFTYVRKAEAWRLRRPNPIHLVIEGEDYSDLAKDNIDAIIRLLTERPASRGPARPGARESRGAARNSSVETRRASVIRV